MCPLLFNSGYGQKCNVIVIAGGADTALNLQNSSKGNNTGIIKDCKGFYVRKWGNILQNDN